MLMPSSMLEYDKKEWKYSNVLIADAALKFEPKNVKNLSLLALGMGWIKHFFVKSIFWSI